MLAPGTAPPVASVTPPRIVPVATCALAAATVAHSQIHSAAHFHPGLCKVINPLGADYRQLSLGRAKTGCYCSPVGLLACWPVGLFACWPVRLLACSPVGLFAWPVGLLA